MRYVVIALTCVPLAVLKSNTWQKACCAALEH